MSNPIVAPSLSEEITSALSSRIVPIPSNRIYKLSLLQQERYNTGLLLQSIVDRIRCIKSRYAIVVSSYQDLLRILSKSSSPLDAMAAFIDPITDNHFALKCREVTFEKAFLEMQLAVTEHELERANSTLFLLASEEALMATV